jgi:hypothetical protein
MLVDENCGLLLILQPAPSEEDADEGRGRDRELNYVGGLGWYAARCRLGILNQSGVDQSISGIAARESAHPKRITIQFKRWERVKRGWPTYTVAEGQEQNKGRSKPTRHHQLP